MMINILIMLQITSSYKEKTAALFLLSAFWTHVLNLLFHCFSVQENYDTSSVIFLTFDLLMIRNIPIIQRIIQNIIWIWCGIEIRASLALFSTFWTCFEFAAKILLFCFSINDNYYFMSVFCDFLSINEIYYLISFCLFTHKATISNKMIGWPRWLRRMSCKL